jgi:hypothetical protein
MQNKLKMKEYETILDCIRCLLAIHYQSASAGRQQGKKILQVLRGVGAGECCLPEKNKV